MVRNLLYRRLRRSLHWGMYRIFDFLKQKALCSCLHICEYYNLYFLHGLHDKNVHMHMLGTLLELDQMFR